MTTPSLARLTQLLSGVFQRSRLEDSFPTNASVGSAAAALTRKTAVSGGFLYDHFVRSQTDILYFYFQTKHGWPRTAVRPHIHVSPTSGAVGADTTLLGNVKFRFRWYWTGLGTGLKIPTTPDSQTILLPITIGDQLEELVVGPVITPPTGVTTSSHLHVEMARLGADLDDDYNTDAVTSPVAANLAYISADLHTEVIATGSKWEFSDYP